MTELIKDERRECSRRHKGMCLMYDDDTIEEIAEKAAEKAVSKMTANLYQDIGKGVVAKLTWLVGVVVVGLYFWLQSKGVVK